MSTNIAGANSLFFKIEGAKAPIALVLNTPLVTNSQKSIWSSQLADHLVNEINKGPCYVNFLCWVLNNFNQFSIKNVVGARIAISNLMIFGSKDNHEMQLTIGIADVINGWTFRI